MKKNVSLNVLIITTVVAALLAGTGSFLIGKNSAGSIASIENGQEVVAETNQGKITADDLYATLKSQFGNDTLFNLVDKMILDKLTPVTEDMKTKVNAQIDQLKKQYGDQFGNVLIANGFKDEAQYRDMVLVSFQREAYVTNYVKTNVITEKEIQELYDSKAADIRASHILIKPASTSETDLAAAKAKAEEVIKKLNEGAKFEDLAKEYSADTGSAENGGDLDFFNKGDMVKEFEEAAYNLAKGEYTKEPVKSQYGYHVILKTDEKTKESLDKVKDSLLEELAASKLKEDSALYSTTLEKMRKDNGFKISDKELQAIYDSYQKAMEALSKQQ